jgi:peptidoglycan/LPS O-acetylase OafA/YrhL
MKSACSRAVGPSLGVLSLVLWFMPLVNVEPTGALAGLRVMFPEGVKLYQAGQHIGGIAYLVLAAGVGCTYFSWRRQMMPSAVFAGLGLSVCAVFAIEASDSIAWGLVSLLCVFGASLWHAVAMRRDGTPVQSRAA